jgi:hypothetical protein
VTKDRSEDDELVEAERREREIESGQVEALREGDFWQRVESLRRK